MFADDTNIFHSGNDLKNLFDVCNSELKKLAEMVFGK